MERDATLDRPSGRGRSSATSSGRLKPRPTSANELVGTVRARPSVLAVPLLLLGVCIATGIILVLQVSRYLRRDVEHTASGEAADHASLLMRNLDTLAHLATGAAGYVSAGAGLNYTSLVQLFPATARTLLSEMSPQLANTTLQLAPQGVVTAAEPSTSATAANSLGVDYLASSSSVSNATLLAMAANRLILMGPVTLMSSATQSLVAMRPVFLSGVPASDSFSQPAWVTSPPATCPASLCYQSATQTKFWGLVMAVTTLEALIGQQLQAVRDAGYDYQLLTSVSTPGAAIGWNGMAVLAKSVDSLSGPMTASVNVGVYSVSSPNAQWTLAVQPVNRWTMSWVTPCYAVVVVVSCCLALIVFFFMLGRAQQELLLYSLVPPHMVAKLRQSSMGNMAVDEFSINTPAEVLLDLLSDCLNGRLPDSTTVVQLRATLLSLQDIYRPTDFNEQLKAADLDDEVADALYALVGKGGKDAALPFTSSSNRDGPALVRMPSVLSDNDRPTLNHGNSSSLGVELSHQSVSSDLQAVLATLLRTPQENTRRRASSIWHSGMAEGGGGMTISHNGIASAPQQAVAAPMDMQTSSHSQLLDTLMAADNSSPPVIQESALKAGVRRLSNLLTFGGKRDDLQGAGPLSLSPQATVHELSSTSRPGSGNNHVLTPSEQHSIAPVVVEELNHLLEQAYSSWTFNAFALDEASRGRPLSVLAYFILHRTGLIKTLGLKPVKVARFLQALEGSYMDNPYHCRTHAADVLQTFHIIITKGGFTHAYVDPIRHLACIIAAAAHDVEHEGLTNDYLINTESMLAMRYNDRSPMENHHLAAMYSLLKHPAHNFIQHFPRDMRDTLRKTVIELVLGTDMKQHITITSQFKSVHKSTIEAAEQQAASAMLKPSLRSPSVRRSALSMKMLGSFKNQVAVAPLGVSGNSFGPPTHAPLDETERLLSLQVALKVADLGHLAEELEVHKGWVGRLEEEFFKQGDKEREKGLTISPLFDRNKPGVTKSQIGFLDFVGRPLFRTFTSVFPSTQPLLESLEENYHYWKDLAEPAPPPLPTADRANASPSPPPLTKSKSQREGIGNKVVAFSDHV